MAKMVDLIREVLIELRYGAGQGVQVHLEEGIRNTISRTYRTLMRERVWRDYTITTEYDLDLATGTVTGSLVNVLENFSDIIAVFLDNDSTPLPTAPVGVNPRTLKRPALVSSGGNTIFTVYPKRAGKITLISRIIKQDVFDINDEVPFYRDVLVLAAAYSLSVKSGTNDALTITLGKELDKLVRTHSVNEFATLYQLNAQRGAVPTEWFADNG